MSDLDVMGALTRLEQASTALRNRLRDRTGVSGTDLSVLQYVWRARSGDRSVRVKDLTSHLGLTGPAVTGVIDRLERQGILQRVPNPEDGRSRFIELTPGQEQVFAAALDSTNEQLHELLSSFSERERRRLVRIVDRIVSALDGGVPPTS
ncbi:MarR family transcriptional regulator [Curtobacterium sp. MCPF17_047]|uniref:MarR family winged helix-turn-helix transcriptional regulator n=1 Tax=unclassified Curtobacterium TaxID=257496 RepID=UPI000DA82FF1|nr:MULTISPECIES: MarR family transcriptional regulator [unclassified Curtobacterium]PZF61361.1 MarR family transcriptional regulator [Curtobacterium sp. MCPF17_047]WIB11968.1 MarR family transcriptional regulator [Curtobacterium sp. MCPF17_052]